MTDGRRRTPEAEEWIATMLRDTRRVVSERGVGEASDMIPSRFAALEDSVRGIWDNDRKRAIAQGREEPSEEAVQAMATMSDVLAWLVDIVRRTGRDVA